MSVALPLFFFLFVKEARCACAVRHDDALSTDETVGYTVENGTVISDGRSVQEDEIIPQVMAAYNIASSVMYAVKAVDEARFRGEDFAAKLTAGTELARSHVEAIHAASLGEEEFRADGWLALKALDKFFKRVTTACENELKGSWVHQGLWFFGNVLGNEKKKDNELSAAVSTLHAESNSISKKVATLAKNSLCPMLLEEVHNQILAADQFAKSFSRATGRSMYEEIASNVWIYPNSSDISATPHTYVTVLDKDCFDVQDKKADNRLHEPNPEHEGDMIEEFKKMFDDAEVLLDEFLTTCPEGGLNQLSGEARKVAMCLPDMHDAIRDAELWAAVAGATANVLAKLGPVLKMYQASTMIINSMFDSSSLWALLQAGTQVSTAWFSSLAWLGYRLSQNFPIRDECIAAARNLTEAELSVSEHSAAGNLTESGDNE